MAEQFTFFWAGPFSQWHPAVFVIDGVTYNCAEQYMMAEKARLFGDTAALNMIMATSNPSDQKRYGRQVARFKEASWTEVAREVVYKANLAKFGQNADLLQVMRDTLGTTLVEASPEDRIWGVGLRKSDPLIHYRSQWRGTNWLGEALMRARKELLGA